MHRPGRGRRATIAVLLTLAVAGLAVPATANPEEERLDRAQERLSDVRAELEAARSEAEAEAEALAVAEARLEEILATVGEAERAVERQRLAVDEAESQLAALEAELEDHKQATQSRVSSLYQQGGDGALTALFADASTTDVIDRGALLGAVNRNERQVFESVIASERAVDAQVEHLAEERDTLERVLAQQERVLAEVEELREDRAVAAAEAEAEVEELEQHEADLEEEAREFAAASRRGARTDRTSRSGGNGGGQAQASSAQTQASTSSGGGSSGGGGWRWPTRGQVTSEYGPRWGRLHAGIDIANSTGTPVVAARGGTVTHTGSMSGYGNIVLIDHGGGIETAYAHLNSIAVGSGQQVSAGQRVGGMGCTGSCTGTHLHFEVRVNGNAQNPRGYLP